MADAQMMPQGDATTGAPESVGQRLKQAREAAGMDLPHLSEITKIPTRMLVLIEAGNFAALPARTYATGFTRTYARALGLDETEYVAAVRAEIGLGGPVEPLAMAAFEPGDPARVPTARLAWLAALGAVAVVIAGLFLWRTYYMPAVNLPSLLPADEATAAEASAPAIAPGPPEPIASGLPSEAATAAGALPGPAAPAAMPPHRVVPLHRARPVTRQAPAPGGVSALPASPAAPPLAASTGIN